MPKEAGSGDIQRDALRWQSWGGEMDEEDTEIRMGGTVGR